jgi:hypothetical protein
VAMYPIESHFDIRAGYNPVTGETTNVIDENTTDRRWYEREYMRVDWSKNMVNDPNFFEIWYPKAFGELELQPVAFFDDNPNSELASNFKELGKGYMDITSRWLLKPATINYYGYDIPQCLLMNLELNPGMQGGSIECNDQEVVIRTSMMKVPESDYEVREIAPLEEDVADVFYTSRFDYDRQYGTTDKGMHWLLIRYNLWEKSHDGRACGVDRIKSTADALCQEVNADGVASKPNSQCDMQSQKCTIPFTDRKVKPLAFFLDSKLPPQLNDASQKAIDDWNAALMVAIATAREAECRRVGGDRAECHTRFFDASDDSLKNPDKPKASNGPAAVMCHNPVIATDHAACGGVQTDPDTGKPVVIRTGDIRRHMIAWWNNPSFEAPLGVVVLGQDPLTGEHVSSMANIFGDGMESAISIYRDWIQLANGDVLPSEYADGVPEQLYGTSTLPLPSDPTRDPALDSLTTQWQRKRFKTMNKAELDGRLKGVDPRATAARLGMVAALKGVDGVEAKMAAVKAYAAKQASLGTKGFGGGGEFASKFDLQANKLKKSGFESQIVNDQWISGFGLDPKAVSGNPTAMNAVSPLGQLSPMAIDAIEEEWGKHLQSNHACKYPSNIWKIAYGHFDGLGAKYKARYKDGEVATGKFAKMAGVEGTTIDRQVRGKLIYWELFEMVYTDILEHEMGHNFSLDHNFGASWDAVNYSPNYWTLRANGKAMTDPANKACDPAAPRAKDAPDTCMGPRYLDPESADELGTAPGNEHDQISAYTVSSFMDYHEDSRYWPGGLGQYDKMAAKFIYGDLVELFDDEDKSLIPNVKKVSSDIKGTLDSQLGGPWSYNFTSGVGSFSQPIHYTEVGRKLNLFDPRRCRDATDEEKASGYAQHGLVCAPVQRDHSFVRDMDTGDTKVGTSNSYIGYWGQKEGIQGCKQKAATGELACKIRWPYKHGPSHFANYPHIAVFDQGADFYEVTQDILNWHNLHNAVGFYRAHNREWNPENVEWHVYHQFYRRMHLLAWDSINSAVRYASFFPDDTLFTNPIAISDDWGRGEVLAMTQLFDQMQEELLRPQPGAYGGATKQIGQIHDLYSVPDAKPSTPDFQIGVLDASYIDSQFDMEKGYWFKSYMKRLGHYVEKPLAAIGLTDSRPPLSIVSRDTYLDGRNVMFSFRSAMPQAFDRLLAGAFADDWDTVAPYVVPGEKLEAGMSPMHILPLWQTGAIARPAGAKVLDPLFGYRAKVPAMILTMLFQPIDSNMEMVNRARIWIEGGPEGVKVADADKVVFYDPAAGTTWGATKFGTEVIDGKTVQIGIGARMLAHANELLAAAYNVKTDAAGQVVYVGGQPVIDPASTETTLTIKDPDAAAKLKQHVGFLNVTRQVLWYLGFGPLGRGEDDF